MFISQKEKDAIKRGFNNVWNNINTLYEGKRQMNDLFAKDSHGTIRPKVDLLTDVVDKTYTDAAKGIARVRNDMLLNVAELQKRIEKIEKLEMNSMNSKK